MLSTETIHTIKSTVPLLEQHGRAITDAFYPELFRKYPFLKNIFNMANQGKGDQSRALSDAVIAYANNIDNVETLLPTVARIANKHASLGVQQKHYEAVGETLLEAIQTVLVLPNHHPALLAWAEAYDVLAQVFVDAETIIYKANTEQLGGWLGFRDFYIDRIVEETPEVKSFYLKPVDLEPVPSFKGGQYVGVRVRPQGSEYQQIRQYSLSRFNHLRISVKAEKNGLVSNHLHNSQVGDCVQLQAPTGVFTLANRSKKHIFIAGGVGITPLMSMLEQALSEGAQKQDVMFIQCSRDQAHQIFAEDIAALVHQDQFIHKRCFEYSNEGDHQGYLNVDMLQKWLKPHEFNADNAQVYFCGPKPFMTLLNRCFLNLGFNAQDIHCETFGPTIAL